MIRKILLSSAVFAAFSMPALAQNSVVREAVPMQSTAILANSPQDIALQEEIRKIRAYNAYIDSQVGITDDAGFAAASVTEYTAPVTTYTAPATQFQGQTIELFETPAPTTQVTYAATTGRAIAVTPTTTFVDRQSITGTSFVHRVVEGDTLYSLARGNCVDVGAIQDKNALSDNNIRLGQTLTLPASQCGTAIIPASSVTASNGYVRKVMPVPTSLKTHDKSKYAVLPKDSLYSIGRRYCVSANELASFNGIDTKTAIQPGQILRLPAAACAK